MPELRLETVFPAERHDEIVAALRARASVRGAGLRPLPELACEGAALHRRRRARQPRARPRSATCSRPRTGRCSPRTARRSASRRTTSPSTARSSPASRRRSSSRVDELEVVSDSELLVKQMRGEYRVKNEALRELSLEAARLARQARPRRRYRAVRREHNELADRLVNEALDARLSRGYTRRRPRM